MTACGVNPNAIDIEHNNYIVITSFRVSDYDNYTESKTIYTESQQIKYDSTSTYDFIKIDSLGNIISYRNEIKNKNRYANAYASFGINQNFLKYFDIYTTGNLGIPYNFFQQIGLNFSNKEYFTGIALTTTNHSQISFNITKSLINHDFKIVKKFTSMNIGLGNKSISTYSCYPACLMKQALIPKNMLGPIFHTFFLNTKQIIKRAKIQSI